MELKQGYYWLIPDDGEEKFVVKLEYLDDMEPLSLWLHIHDGDQWEGICPVEDGADGELVFIEALEEN